jgi:nicotinamide riboside kinase
MAAKNERSCVITRIALLGAESTGKTQLSLGLAKSLRERGYTVHVVPEFLRTWCDQQGRTPLQHEQAGIAQQQALAVLAQPSGIVISDTSPLMTAVYSHKLFSDESLYEFAFAHHELFDMTLLTGLDLPWVPDGLQRDGPHVREPIDAMVRAALHGAGIDYKVIYGRQEERLHNALLALGLDTHSVDPVLLSAQLAREQGQFALNQGRTAWACDKCSDADCEHRLFTGLLTGRQ